MLTRHWPLLAVLVPAVVVRVLVAIAYRPALFFPDSWDYLAHGYGVQQFGGLRPAGYSLAINAISWLAGHHVSAISTLQHVAGIGTGLVVYWLMLRRGVARWLATLTAAAVLLEAYAIVLEQTVLAETFFTFGLVVSVCLLAGARRVDALALSGVLLASAMTMRSSAVFVVPLWLGYAIYRHRRSWRLAAAVLGLVLPLAAFTITDRAVSGQSGWTHADGWFLYGRAAAIADCSKFTPPPGTRILCLSPGERNKPPLDYIWNPSSPAWRLFPGPYAKGSSPVLHKFAVRAIEAQPLAYAGAVGRDLLRYFDPGEYTPGGSDGAIVLPSVPRTWYPYMDVAVAGRYLAPFWPSIHQPAGVARAYTTNFHFPRPALALLLLLPLVLLAARPFRKVRTTRHGAEVLLATGAATALVVGSTATSAFVIRYLVPALPLFFVGAALAFADLQPLWLRRRRAAATA